MKIIIKPYLYYYGPYQIAEKILFWLDKDDDRVHNFGTWLAAKKDGSDTALTKLCEWVESKRKRKIEIKIHKYDTWSMDYSLSLIIAPMLRQLKATKHGIPGKFTEHATFEEGEIAWDAILDKMIFSFEEKSKDNSPNFYDVQPEIEWDTTRSILDENGFHPVVWKIEGVYRQEEADAYYAKVQEGFDLFGVHFQNLWD